MSRIFGGPSQLAQQFGGTPMFGSPDSVPRFTGPVNINVQGNATGAMMQLGLPMLMQSFMPANMRPGQLFPSQNMFDQMVAQQFFAGQQRSMALAANRDTSFAEDFAGGLTRMFTGRNPTAGERQRNFQMAQQFSQMMPMASMLLGPDIIDQMHGSRGSAIIMSQRLHSAGRTRVDPVTGSVGMSAESAATMSNELFERLYGRGAPLAGMHGVSAGEAGAMMEQLQMRGLLGAPQGLAERLRALPGSLDEGTVTRLAERLPEMQGISTNTVGRTGRLERAKQRIRDSHQQMMTSGGAMSHEDIGKLAGGDDILRVSDAGRTADRLKGLAGSVAAMKEMLGPNSSMEQIMNGLHALTQGGLATMPPAQIEKTVRTMHDLARTTGIGMQRMTGMLAQGGALADRLGLDRQLAVGATMSAAAYGAAIGDRGIPRAWGAPTTEGLTLMDQQLRMAGAASPAGNQVNAVLRMADEGILKPATGTEAAAIVEALRSGQASYTFNGKTKSMLMSRNALGEIISRDAGVDNNTAMTYFLDTYGNQEYGAKYNTQQITRELQRVEINNYSAEAFQRNASSRSQGKLDALRRAGVVGNEEEMAALNRGIGAAMSDAFMNMDLSKFESPEERNATLGEAGANAIRQTLRQKMPGASEAEIEAATQKALQAYGGQNQLGSTGYAGLGRKVSTHPRTAGKFKNPLDMRMNFEKQEAAKRRIAESESNAAMASAFAGLGGTSLLGRAADAIAGAAADSSWQEVLGKMLGGVNVDELAERDVVFAEIRDASKRADAVDRDKSGKITKQGQADRDDQARLIRALRLGGKAAADELTLREAKGNLDPKTRNALLQAIDKGADERYSQNRDRTTSEGSYAGTSVDEAEFFASQGDMPGGSTGGYSSTDPKVVERAGQTTEQTATASREKPADTGAGDSGGTQRMQMTGTLEIVGDNRVRIAASGLTGQPNHTPVYGN
jgi:hypothetical protein